MRKNVPIEDAFDFPERAPAGLGLPVVGPHRAHGLAGRLTLARHQADRWIAARLDIAEQGPRLLANTNTQHIAQYTAYCYAPRMTRRQFYDSAIVQKAYTAKKLLDLAFLIQSQVTEVYVHKGMIFPVSCSSTLLYLGKFGPASVTEVARVLQHPHQTVAQHLATLSRLHIIDKRVDEADRRRIEYFLTDAGKVQADLLDQYNVEAADVFERLNRDIGTDLGDVLDIGIAALNRRSMADRFWDLFELDSAKS